MQKLISEPRVWTLSDFLKREDRQYRIPIYQRDYQWSDDQIDDFEEDLFRLTENDTEHFFGTLVLTHNSPENPNNKDQNISYVIDGQQRLTTALLTVVVIKHLLLELSCHLSISSKSSQAAAHLDDILFLGEPLDPQTQIPRLSANRVNQVFLTRVLTTYTSSGASVIETFENLSEDDQARSDVMYRAYLRLRSHIITRTTRELKKDQPKKTSQGFETIISSDEATEAFNFIYKLLKSIRTQAMFVSIEVRSWTDAFSVFEGLNNRGMDLSEKDIVKNSILAKGHIHNAQSKTEYFRELERKWASIESRIADTKFSNFLRHYLLLFREDVALKRVLRELTEHFQDSTPEEMLDELENAAKAYEFLVKPSLVNDLDIRTNLDILKVYETERAYPIALAALLSNLTKSSLKQIFHAIEVLYVRRTIIMQRDNKAIEADIGLIARTLFEQKQAGVKGAIESIRELTPNDDEFEKHFLDRRDMKPAVARMVLTQIENHLRAKQHQLEFSKTTLEHICPQDPRLWRLKKDQKERHPLFVGRLGNLTLLTNKANASLSNKPFADKKNFYKKEALKINTTIVNKANWTELEISSQQKWLASLAVQVWKR